MPCNVDDINITEPAGPSLPGIPGFGVPFGVPLPEFSLPSGFPENLNELFKILSMILPPGTLKPTLQPNFAKDIFDGIMNLLDKFFPFLMLYKFFLPILNLIICIIEVLCAISNPIKLIRALKRLFRYCLPEFLSLFPIFALIVMLLSLLFLLLAIIEYIIEQILKIINILLRNIKALTKAFSYSDEGGILAIVKKIGILLCSFQNIFVILSIFAVIIQAIKDMLKLIFQIPPCSDTSGDDGCCTTEVCPSFIRDNEEFTRYTGTLQFYSKVSSGVGALPAPLNTFGVDIRQQSYQFFDNSAPQDLQVINITDAFDITQSPKPVFFPTDANYSSGTPITQVPYKVDLRVFYNPSNWGRNGLQYGDPRYVRFKDCIVLYAPTTNFYDYQNTASLISSGVIKLAGGSGSEDDGRALLGFEADGITISSSPATLENFLFTPAVSALDPILEDDGYNFADVEYTFKINHEVLLQKSLITLGCIPTVALDKNFTNIIYGGKVAINYGLLNGLALPDVSGAQDCLQNALDALRLDMSQAGVAAFKATTDVCLNKLKDDTNSAINGLIGIGFDPYKSTFSVDPNTQFTTRKIKVSVQLNEGNGLSLTDNLPASVADSLAQKLKAELTFGYFDNFSYDGSKLFTGNISSDQAGSGTIKIYFDNQIISELNIPSNLNEAPSSKPKELPFKFIFTSQVGDIGTGIGDSDGMPRRGPEDVGRENN